MVYLAGDDLVLVNLLDPATPSRGSWVVTAWTNVIPVLTPDPRDRPGSIGDKDCGWGV